MAAQIISVEQLRTVAIERNLMTGDYRCRLCDVVWATGASIEPHKHHCLLAGPPPLRTLTPGEYSMIRELADDVERLHGDIERVIERVRHLEAMRMIDKVP